MTCTYKIGAVSHGGGAAYRRYLKQSGKANVGPADVEYLINSLRDSVMPNDGEKVATEPFGYMDLIFTPDRSVSVAWGLANEAERAAILAAVSDATSDAMKFVETELGTNITWLSWQHYTSRPTVDLLKRDEHGELYTEICEVPFKKADPDLHQHNVILSTAFTDDGHPCVFDPDEIVERCGLFDAVFHASVATKLRKEGFAVVLGPHGTAKLTAIPDEVVDHLSRCMTQHAWDALGFEERTELISALLVTD